MAEHGYDGYGYGSWPSTPPIIPQPHTRDSPAQLPSLSSFYGNWPNYNEPFYPQIYGPTPPRPPDANIERHHFQTSFSPALYGGLRPPDYQGPTAMSHQTLPPMRSMTRHFDTRMQEGPDVDFPRPQPVNQHAHLDTPMLQNATPRATLPHLHVAWNLPTYDTHRLPGQTLSSATASSSRPQDNNSEAATRPANAAPASSERTATGNAEPSHQARPAITGLVNQRPERSNNQSTGTPDWRPVVPFDYQSLQSPRLERNTTLSRSSHRRSFDRYSNDVSQSSSAQGPDDVVRASAHRSRRPRTMLGDRMPTSGLQARFLAQYHPNVPSPMQLQNLKKRLKKRVRTGLAKDVSPTCDICQKDYSEKLVEPTEEEEVAVILPCKHVFGEHCITTWFETCKTQKNKITCPMCRTLLIDPARRREEIMEMIASQGYPGLERFVEDESRWVIAERGLEGDFANP